MADKNNNKNEETNRSTDSNLPILFANGYPTSLDKMNREQLELFIPFLAKCSRYVSADEDVKAAPEWWPTHIEYKVPLSKPNNFKKNWEETLRRVVENCYEHHKHPFLLKYSQDLSENEPANLRYVRATDSTTSLWSRHPKKLLLTFRNENMLYDKKKRMTLWKKDETPSSIAEHDEYESTFDVMLCDHCDAEFYSDEAHNKHELKCGKKAEQELKVVDSIVLLSDDDEEEEEVINEPEKGANVQTDFMAYLFLKSTLTDELPRRNLSFLERSLSPKKKKTAQRTRHVTNKKEKDLERLIPFSSPAGIILTKKAVVSQKYVEESLEEIEEFCQAKPNTKIARTSRQRLQIAPETAVIKEMRRPRPYYWPKRCLNSTSREANFEFLNRSLMSEMKPCLVTLEKMSEKQITTLQDRLKRVREEKIQAKAAECVDLCSDSEDSITLEEDFSLLQCQGEFTMSYQSRLGMIPGPSSSTPKFTIATARLPDKNESFIAAYQQFSFTTSQSSNIVNSIKRARQNDDNDSHVEKKTIQKWIQNVNCENFVNSSLNTAINTN